MKAIMPRTIIRLRENMMMPLIASPLAFMSSFCMALSLSMSMRDCFSAGKVDFPIIAMASSFWSSSIRSPVLLKAVTKAALEATSFSTASFSLGAKASFFEMSSKAFIFFLFASMAAYWLVRAFWSVVINNSSVRLPFSCIRADISSALMTPIASSSRISLFRSAISFSLTTLMTTMSNMVSKVRPKPKLRRTLILKLLKFMVGIPVQISFEGDSQSSLRF